MSIKKILGLFATKNQPEKIMKMSVTEEYSTQPSDDEVLLEFLQYCESDKHNKKTNVKSEQDS
jgi:hypothetical protein